MIHGSRCEDLGAWMLSSESIGEFGDRRLARRGSIVFNRIVATGSLVQRRVGKSRAGELGMARFLESPAVTKEAQFPGICRVTGGILQTNEVSGPGLGAPEFQNL